MLTATNEKIRFRQERLDASMQLALESTRLPLLEKGAAILEAHQEMERALQEALREGMEWKELLHTLTALHAQAQREVQWFEKALDLFELDGGTVPTGDAQLREAKGFLTGMRDLEAKFSAPVPSFDESQLSPVSDGGTAAGYVSVSEARARLLTKQQL